MKMVIQESGSQALAWHPPVTSWLPLVAPALYKLNQTKLSQVLIEADLTSISILHLFHLFISTKHLGVLSRPRITIQFAQCFPARFCSLCWQCSSKHKTEVCCYYHCIFPILRATGDHCCYWEKRCFWEVYALSACVRLWREGILISKVTALIGLGYEWSMAWWWCGALQWRWAKSEPA